MTNPQLDKNEELFSSAFDTKKFQKFLKDHFFNYDPYIKGLETLNKNTKLVGIITTKDKKQLPVFEVVIKANTQLARNRVGLRNIVLQQIKPTASDGALAVFVDEDSHKWRLSFMSINPKFDDGKIILEETDSKRYTYLLGKEQLTRTARKQLNPLDQNSTLADIEKAFAVEPLNKEFYEKLFKWYERAQKQVEFPNDEQVENHKKIALIRLLTRLLFIWFIKQKGLVNNNLFQSKKLQSIINWDKPSSYYKAVLQNLFFATLNVEIDDREFRYERDFKGKNKHYGDQHLFRYHKLVEDNETWKQLFKETPFFNGGLFECLDRKATEQEQKDYEADKKAGKTVRDEKKMFRTDSFSDRQESSESSKSSENSLKVPNDLFFNEDENTLGLINLLEQYQFTVEESTPSDIDVALDPELLGKVFENLLASYNTKTGEQTRKATGSFYTPREIVNYMVNASLKQYLQTKTDLSVIQLDELFSDNVDSTKLNSQLKQQVVTAIDNIKVLDPAVGSGAFPMVILQRLLAVLAKVDPQNSLYKKRQLDKVDAMEDVVSRDRAKKTIEGIFSNKNGYNQYGKKLFLIENCIYGVDIQPIAITIAKLRFFISLTIEQETNQDPKTNYGIEPLPNLSYKLTVGDALINFPDNYFKDSITVPKLKKLLKATIVDKHKYFRTTDTKQKKKLKNDIDSRINNCISEMQESLGSLATFDTRINFWEVFADQSGFDIVIGNPPYVSNKDRDAEYKKKLKQCYVFADDLYSHFTFFAQKVARDKTGVFAFITSKTFWTIQTKDNLRQLLLNNKIIEIYDTASPFEAMVDTCIFIVKKYQQTVNYSFKFSDGKVNLLEPQIYEIDANIYNSAVNNVFFIPSPVNLILYQKLNDFVAKLMKYWWTKINTSKNITNWTNSNHIPQYRNSLKAGDITLLGLLTEGGQGLATANNGKYVAVKANTLAAQKIKTSRVKKLLEANKTIENPKYDNPNYLDSLTELQIRDLFDSIKQQYGRDIFGQGYLYRIIADTEIAVVQQTYRRGKEKWYSQC